MSWLMQWLGIALCSLVAIAGAVFAWAPVWILRRLTGVDEALLRRARLVKSEERRVVIIARGAGQGSWADELITELASCQDDPQRMVAANEALADAEHALELRAHWPVVAARLVALAGLLGLVVAWFVAGW